MSVARALATNTAAQVVGKAVSILLGVLVVGLMTRLLGQEGFGKYSTANAFLQVFAILMDLGLNVMIVQMLGEHKGDAKEENRISSAFFTLRILLAVVMLSIATAVAFAIPGYDGELKLAILVLVGSTFFTVLNQVVIGVQQRHLRMGIVAIAEVAGRAVLLGGVLIAVAQGWGLLPVALIVSLGGLVNFLVNLVVAMRYASFRWNVDVALWQTAFRRAWPIGVSILFGLIYFRADMLILGWVRPQTDVGVYGAAYRVLEILITLPFMYAGILLPLIANAWKERRKAEFQQLIQRSFDAMAIVTLPLMIGVQAVATPVMVLVAGPDFAASGGILQILIVATGAIFLATMLSHAVVAMNAQKDMLPWYVGTAILTLIGYVTLLPPYGMWAAAWLTLGSEVAMLVGNLVVTVRRGGFAIDWTVAGKALIASLFMYAVVALVAVSSWPLAIVAGIVVYAALTYAFGMVTRDMLRAVTKR